MTDPVLLNIDARGIATVTLNRPHKHNAFDDAVIRQLSDTFSSVDKDPLARLMVLAASGKNFCAGADLAWMQRMANYSYEDNLQDASALAQMLQQLNTMSKPTIARVQGAAFGGALGLISCCDIAVASSSASFCLSEVRIGLLPATISPYVIAAMGQRAARRYFLSAERFGPETARRLGLISDVVDEAALDASLNSLTDALLQNSPRALQATKQLIFDVSDKPIDAELMHTTSQRIAAIRVSDEGQEGLNAFLEKRPPGWLKS